MEALKSFLFFNQLSQIEVAQYLGISKGYMSTLVAGRQSLPLALKIKLIENDKGWNVEYLKDEIWSKLESTKVETNVSEVTKLKTENEQLRQQVKWLQSIVENYLKK